ncbi:MAG TPA: DUF2007 domain-containing protein [Actinobacteria bacterium]|nr:DUF2007 domain-containing protein [Actinomycetota bacterium]
MVQNELVLIIVLLVVCPLLIYLAIPSKEKKDVQIGSDTPAFKQLITIASFRSPGEAHVAKGMLESAGIEAHLANDLLASLSFDTVWADGGIHLRVNETDVEAARELLASKQPSSDIDC